MKRIEKIKAMEVSDFVDFILDLDLCVVCKESNSKKECFICHSLEEEKVVYKKVFLFRRYK